MSYCMFSISSLRVERLDNNNKKNPPVLLIPKNYFISPVAEKVALSHTLKGLGKQPLITCILHNDRIENIPKR